MPVTPAQILSSLCSLSQSFSIWWVGSERAASDFRLLAFIHWRNSLPLSVGGTGDLLLTNAMTMVIGCHFPDHFLITSIRM